MPYTGGGTVQIIRVRGGSELVVREWTSDNGQEFSGIAHAIPCETGDQVKVRVDHDDSVSHDLAEAEMSLYLVDRISEVQGANVIDFATYENWGGSSSTYEINLPVASSGDLLVGQFVVGGDAGGVTIPSGWTLLESQDTNPFHARWFYKIADGTEGSTATVTTANANHASSIVWVVRDDIDWSSNLPDSNSNKDVFDAPAVSVSHGAGVYWVFVAVGFTRFEDLSGPPGYAELAEVGTVSSSHNPQSYVGYAQVQISTSEDPGTVSFESETSPSRSVAIATIAVRAHTS